MKHWMNSRRRGLLMVLMLKWGLASCEGGSSSDKRTPAGATTSAE